MARGVDGRIVFVDDRDRELFLAALATLKSEMNFSLLAYCLMGNHFHLAIKIGQIPLSNIIHRLLTRYALTFNACHDRTGHLFQARFKAVLCVDEAYLFRLVEYIHANPVRSGMVSRNEDWQWSSAKNYASGRRTPLTDPNDLPAILDKADPESAQFDPWPKKIKPALLRVPAEPFTSLESLGITASSRYDMPLDTIRSKRRDAPTITLKRAFVFDALKVGYSLAEISRWMGTTPAAAWNLARRKEINEIKSLTL